VKNVFLPSLRGANPPQPEADEPQAQAGGEATWQSRYKSRLLRSYLPRNDSFSLFFTKLAIRHFNCITRSNIKKSRSQSFGVYYDKIFSISSRCNVSCFSSACANASNLSLFFSSSFVVVFFASCKIS